MFQPSIVRLVLTTASSLAIFAVPVAATAQGSSGSQGSATASPPLTRALLSSQLDANFKSMDSNGDKVLSVAEIEAVQKVQAAQVQASISKRLDAEFARLDTNKDGHLTAAEFKAGAPSPRVKPAAELLAQFDRNKDGKVTAEEHRATPLANFDRIDTNKDGTLSAQEQSAVRQQR